jgi:multimeric flavodoxin WrbA
MRIKTAVIVMGSPRKNGNSIALAENVAAGIEAAGGNVKRFYLHDMDIKPCDACMACRGASSAECIIDDDMQQLYPDLRQTDALVIASPIYWYTVNAQTKLFMDRCYALGGPQGNALRGKRIGIVLTYGDSDPFNSGCVNALRSFQDAFSNIVDMVYGSASSPGEIKANHDLMARAYRLGKQLVADV